ncbi:MAG: flagellar basal body rod protein [Ectobacillus sp.]
MKKFLTFIAAGVLVIIALASLGHLLGLAIGVLLLYWSFKSFVKAQSLLGKFGWGIVGLAGLAVVFGNFPAVIGLLAIALLYYGYRDWKKNSKQPQYSQFSNFDEEWEKVMKQY